MTSHAISEIIFIREYTRELHNKNVAVFAGAGLSVASGYVDWKGLLREITEDLHLDPKKEYDLVTVAQYFCNEAGGNRARLTQTIFDYFAPTNSPTSNHRILARLPIQTYWTTNYDKLIEDALKEAKKVPDVKYTIKQLAVTRQNRDAVIYKMHGDIDHPADVVITKDDYEAYPVKMNAFMSALGGDLIEKTFLFLGFSFTDPNIDYILSRVRVQYEQHQRAHYCIQKKVSKADDESNEDFEYRKLKQEYFIRDLKRFNVNTVLVNEFREITEVLQKVATRYKRSSVFISGAADDYGTWNRSDAQDFLHKLSYRLIEKNNRIVTGFGVGVGSAVVNGSLAYLNDSDRTVTDDDVVMRPFPQVATGGASLADEWTQYRKGIIDYAGIAVFVFGNKKDGSGNLQLSDGVKEEFELCVQAGVMPLPVGATGFMASELWNEVWGNFDTYYPGANAAFRAAFEKLGDASATPNELLGVIMQLIEQLQRD